MFTSELQRDVQAVCAYVSHLEQALVAAVSENNGCGEYTKCGGREFWSPSCECAQKARDYLPEKYR